jgi:hypothetical protein
LVALAAVFEDGAFGEPLAGLADCKNRGEEQCEERSLKEIAARKSRESPSKSAINFAGVDEK